jgi:hypothetical protein
MIRLLPVFDLWLSLIQKLQGFVCRGDWKFADFIPADINHGLTFLELILQELQRSFGFPSQEDGIWNKVAH